jgi:2-polyprenyl-6-methoxyphenol hydroxylase-like FAD-dependent oxidoreductase
MDSTVIVAGGGPTGLLLAGELALAGVPAIVLERRAEPTTRSQGMAVHGRTLELLAQRGLTDRIAKEEMFAWPRTPFALLWLDLSTVTEADYTFAYPQWRLEKLLEERAVSLGVDVRRGHEVVSLAQDGDGVTVGVRSAAGEHELRGSYLVGCDGANSTVRELAGIGFEPTGGTYHGVLGDVPATDLSLFDAGVRNTGVFGALPIEAGMLRLMTIEFDREPPGDDVPVTAAELRDSIARITGRELEVPESAWVARFGGPTALADRYRSGRVLLAGDAAHRLFVSGTQGVNTGLHDAANLGWKLAAEVNGWASDGLLDSYEAERRPVGERMCMHAQATTVLMDLNPEAKIGALRGLMTELLKFEKVNRHLLQMTTDTRYPVADEAAHPLVGRRAPDAPLRTDAGDTTVATALRSGLGLVLDLSGGRSTALDAVSAWADRVDVVSAQPIREIPAATVLIRPDGHVAYADKTGNDTAGLRSALATWFGPH